MARADSTTRGIATRAASSGTPRLRQLWFGLFGAAAAWSVQLMANYALVAHACYPGRAPLGEPTFAGTRVVAALVSVAALACAVGALHAAREAWRSTRPATDGERESRSTGERRSRFMACAGIMTSAVFVFAVIMNALPLLVGPLCGGST